MAVFADAVANHSGCQFKQTKSFDLILHLSPRNNWLSANFKPHVQLFMFEN